MLEALSEKVDQLVVGGGIANTFLAATGHNVGKSLCEHDLIPTAQALMTKMTARGATIPIAVDVVCGKNFAENEPAVAQGRRRRGRRRHDLRHRPQVRPGAGRHHRQGRHHRLERPRRASSSSTSSAGAPRPSPWPSPTPQAFSLAGGGDTIAAIQKYDIYDKVSYISTAGGAFLEYLEGKVLPAVAMLEARAKD